MVLSSGTGRCSRSAFCKDGEVQTLRNGFSPLSQKGKIGASVSACYPWRNQRRARSSSTAPGCSAPGAPGPAGSPQLPAGSALLCQAGIALQHPGEEITAISGIAHIVFFPSEFGELTRCNCGRGSIARGHNQQEFNEKLPSLYSRKGRNPLPAAAAGNLFLRQ